MGLVSEGGLGPRFKTELSSPLRQRGALTTRNPRSVRHRFVCTKEVVRDNVSSEKYGKM